MSYEFVPWEQDGPLPTVEGAVEAGTMTEVGVTATGYDARPGRSANMNGCGEEGGAGCEAANSRDGIASVTESRWSCAPSLVDGGGPCQVEYTFAEPQDIVDIQVAFWKANERTRTLDVSDGLEEAQLLEILILFRFRRSRRNPGSAVRSDCSPGGLERTHQTLGNECPHGRKRDTHTQTHIHKERERERERERESVVTRVVACLVLHGNVECSPVANPGRAVLNMPSSCADRELFPAPRAPSQKLVRRSTSTVTWSSRTTLTLGRPSTRLTWLPTASRRSCSSPPELRRTSGSASSRSVDT